MKLLRKYYMLLLLIPCIPLCISLGKMVLNPLLYTHLDSLILISAICLMIFHEVINELFIHQKYLIDKYGKTRYIIESLNPLFAFYFGYHLFVTGRGLAGITMITVGIIILLGIVTNYAIRHKLSDSRVAIN